jgi:hypothetical protein
LLAVIKQQKNRKLIDLTSLKIAESAHKTTIFRFS